MAAPGFARHCGDDSALDGSSAAFADHMFEKVHSSTLPKRLWGGNTQSVIYREGNPADDLYMDAKTARTINIREWVAGAGGPSEFVRRYCEGRWEAVQVSQWISPTSPKSIGHKVAREIEERLGKPPGSMDHVTNGAAPSQPARLDTEKLADLLETVEAAIIQSRRQIPARTKARIVAALYADEQASAAASPQAVQSALSSILSSLSLEET